MAKVAFVLANDFEDSEFKTPYDRLRDAGHEVTIIGTEAGKELTGKRGDVTTTTDATTTDVDPADFDALVIPGGYSPDQLRIDENIVGFTRKLTESGVPVAAICHAGQLLVEAGVVEGKRVTSWPSVRTELELAGAEWVDETVVEDGNLITSRNPNDLPAFCDALLARLI